MKARVTFSVILSLLLLTTISSCSTTPVTVETTSYVYSDIPLKERPKGVKLIPPKLEVVNHKNLEEFLKNNEERNGSLVFIAMDVREYENSSYNFAEIDRYVKQLLAVVKYYEEQIEDRRRQAEEAEASSE